MLQLRADLTRTDGRSCADYSEILAHSLGLPLFVHTPLPLTFVVDVQDEGLFRLRVFRRVVPQIACYLFWYSALPDSA